MTVIAYRDRMMACDSCWSDGSLVVAMQPKIFRLRSGALYGAAGDCDDRALMAAVQDARSPEDLPSFDFLHDVKAVINVLIVLPNGDVWQMDTDPAGVMPVSGRGYSAVGSGGRVAIGAMAMGADAVEAVEIACEHDTYCRGPVHHLLLSD